MQICEALRLAIWDKKGEVVVHGGAFLLFEGRAERWFMR